MEDGQGVPCGTGVLSLQVGDFCFAGSCFCDFDRYILCFWNKFLMFCKLHTIEILTILVAFSTNAHT